MFVAKAAGQGTISVGRAVLRDPNNAAIEASGSQADDQRAIGGDEQRAAEAAIRHDPGRTDRGDRDHGDPCDRSAADHAARW